MDVFIAKQIRESVSEPSSSNVYLTFGKSTAWTNESSPPQPNTSIVSFNDVWSNMIGAKRITGNNIRHVIPRFNWTSGTVYTQYSDVLDSLALQNATTKFYVMTSNYSVYKCLFNNNGAPSTVEPNITITTTHFQTSDGYIWKFMYQLTAEERLRFLTPSFLPVKTLEENDNSTQWVVQDNAIDGAIHVIQVTNGGSNYTANDVGVVITGDGLYANAFAVVNTSSNTIQSVIIDNLGYGYTKANISFRSALGSGAAARAVISPPGGHGSDPLAELGGSYLLFDVQLKNSEGGFLTVRNDYRQIAMLESPLTYGSTSLFSGVIANQLTTLTLNGTSVEYTEDESVYQGTSLANASFRGVVTEWDSTNNVIKLSQVEGSPTKDLLIGSNTTASRFVSSVTNPTMQPRSGKLLYTDNIIAVQRASDQTEDYKIILKF